MISINSSYTVWTQNVKDEERTSKEKSKLSCEFGECWEFASSIKYKSLMLLSSVTMFRSVVMENSNQLLWEFHSRPVVYNWSSLLPTVAHIYNVALAVLLDSPHLIVSS